MATDWTSGWAKAITDQINAGTPLTPDQRAMMSKVGQLPLTTTTALPIDEDQGDRYGADVALRPGQTNPYQRSTTTNIPDQQLWNNFVASVQNQEAGGENNGMFGLRGLDIDKVVPLLMAAAVTAGVAAPLAGALGGGVTGAMGSGATIGGVNAAVRGGDVLKGAALGAVGGGVASGVNSLGVSDALGGGVTGATGSGAVTGGTMAALNGGDPITGALWGAANSAVSSGANAIANSSAGATGDGSTNAQGSGGGGVDEISSINGDIGAPAPAPALTDFSNGLPTPDPSGYTPDYLGGDGPLWGANNFVGDLPVDPEAGGAPYYPDFPTDPTAGTTTDTTGMSQTDVPDTNFVGDLPTDPNAGTTTNAGDATMAEDTGDIGGGTTDTGLNLVPGDTNDQTTADTGLGDPNNPTPTDGGGINWGSLGSSGLGIIKSLLGGGGGGSATGGTGGSTQAGNGGGGNSAVLGMLLGSLLNRGNTSPSTLTNDQAQALQHNNDIAQQMWQRYQDVYKPLQDKAISDANNMDSASEQNRVAGVANADVTGQFNTQTNAALERLRSMGVNPDSGAFIDANMRLGGQEAAANAGLQNTARQGLIDRARAARAGLVSATANTPFQTMAGNAATGDAFGRAATTTNNINTAGNNAIGGVASTVLGGLSGVVGGVKDWAGNVTGGWGNSAAGGTGTGSNSSSGSGGDAAVQDSTGGTNLYANGGLITQGYADGGAVRGAGTGTSDSIPAAVRGPRGVSRAFLSDGEFVIPADVVKAKGTEFFNKLVESYHTPVRSHGVRR